MNLVFSLFQNDLQFDFQEFQQKLNLITLLQLLVYVQTLDYQTKTLTSSFRQFRFPLRDFLNHASKASNQYQLIKLKEFFNVLNQNLIIECFTDKSYRMLVTIFESHVYKSKQNIWLVDVWMVNELFYYSYPFDFPNFFNTKLTKDQFEVRFKFIQVFSSINIEKVFWVQEFISSKVSN